MKIKILFLTLFLVISCNNSSNESSNGDIYNLKQTAITNAIQKASPAVVGIHVETKKLVRDWYGRARLSEGGGDGSGFIVSKDGYVITLSLIHI